SLNTYSSTPRIDRKGKQKSGKCQTSAAFFALFNSTLASILINTKTRRNKAFVAVGRYREQQGCF
ncbi:MAG: hypothetical protein ACI3YJ_08360, partial [Prevotella sp.]